MKSATFLALLSTLLSANLVFGAKFPLSDAKKGTNIPVVQNQFIIEVDDLSDIPTKRSFPRVRFKISNLRKFVDLQIVVLDVVYASLQERGVGFDVNKEFDATGLFVGASVTLKSAQV